MADGKLSSFSMATARRSLTCRAERCISVGCPHWKQHTELAAKPINQVPLHQQPRTALAPARRVMNKNINIDSNFSRDDANIYSYDKLRKAVLEVATSSDRGNCSPIKKSISQLCATS